MTVRRKNILAKSKVLISAAIAAVVVILGFLIFAGRPNKPAQAAQRPLDVEVVKVVQQDVSVYSE